MLKVLILLTLFAFFLLGISTLPIFKVSHVQINQNQDCLTQTEILSQTTKVNLIFLSKDKLTQKLKSQYSCLEGITIVKKFPYTLEVNIKVKTPVVRIEGTNFYATADGLIISDSDFPGLPTLYFGRNQDLKLGQKITDQVALNTLKLAAYLLKSDFAASSIRLISPDEIVAYSKTDYLAIFTSQKELGLQVDSLQAILAQSKIEPSKIAKVDLRFSKPVITYK